MSADPKKSDEEQQAANAYALAVSAGTQLVVSVCLGLFAGQWLDKKLGTAPWLLLVGTMAGISLGLYQLIRASAKRSSRR